MEHSKALRAQNNAEEVLKKVKEVYEKAVSYFVHMCKIEDPRPKAAKLLHGRRGNVNKKVAKILALDDDAVDTLDSYNEIITAANSIGDLNPKIKRALSKGLTKIDEDRAAHFTKWCGAYKEEIWDSSEITKVELKM